MTFRLSIRPYAVAVIALFCIHTISAQTEVDRRVDATLKTLSLEEKIGQMTQIDLGVVAAGKICELADPIRLDTQKLKRAFSRYKVGSVLNCGCGFHALERQRWIGIIDSIQEANARFTAHGIPVLYGIDAIHGANYTVGSTLFPQQIGQAATWNPELVNAAAAITAYETRASGIPWNFSPVLDLGRQPLWSRFFETYGEDVYLARQMTKAAITGYQDNAFEQGNVAACMKHFLGYSYPLSGKDRTPAWIGDRELRAYYLPTFQEAIRLKAMTVMVNSGEINGVPVHANPDILSKLLRDELGFEGIAVTDWEDIYKLHTTHRVAETLRDAVKMAIIAGIDMSMTPNDFQFNDLLLDLVRKGEIPESRLDISVRRILKVKYALGIERWSAEAVRKGYPLFASDGFSRVAHAAVSESVTLLKNDTLIGQSNGVLPLSANSRIWVFGNAASSLNLLNGAWTQTWLGQDTRFNDTTKRTLLQALQQMGSTQTLPVTAAWAGNLKNIRRNRPAAVVYCLGETPATEIPGNINQLELSINAADMQALRRLKSLKVPVVLVLCLGRPRIITELVEVSDAVVHAYLPGHEGAKAIAGVLYGQINPSGKLPFTYPRHSGDIVHYDRKHSEDNDINFGDKAYQPLFDFGHGLSYTRFGYQNLTAAVRNDSFYVKVNVINTGSKRGKEVVQLYYRDEFAQVTPSVKKLCAFRKIDMMPGETRWVEFAIPVTELGDIGPDLLPFKAVGNIHFTAGNTTCVLKHNP